MKKSLCDVNLFILLFAVALILSPGDRMRAQERSNLDRGTLYFFTNEGCRPCKQIEPMLRDLAVNGYPITKVDTTAYPQWVQRFRISSTPTLVLVKDNREIKRHSGAVDSGTIVNWFHSIGFNNSPISQISTAGGSSTVAPSEKDFLKKINRQRNNDRLLGDTSTLHQGTRIPSDRAEKAAMDATVRLRVEDPEGISFATGTIIHCHQGEWLVMTCGHVFRDSGGKGKISVEYDFANGQPRRAPGRLVSYDAKSRDIGLVAVAAGVEITPVQVANRNAAVERGKTVFSIGCDHGEPPTIRRTKIKRKAAYYEERIVKYDIYGRPVDGRSGGGLFTEDGKLIGVCNAATVDFDEGIYTALDTIYWQIAQSRLDHLFDGSSQGILANNSPNRNGAIRAQNLDRGIASASPINPAVQIADARPFNKVGLNQNIRPTRNSSDGSEMEVILIVRSKTDPTRTDAITLSDPSPQLLRYLEKIGNRQSGDSRIEMAQLRQQMSR